MRDNMIIYSKKIKQQQKKKKKRWSCGCCLLLHFLLALHTISWIVLYLGLASVNGLGPLKLVFVSKPKKMKKYRKLLLPPYGL
jgi:hypothetical protein